MWMKSSLVAGVVLIVLAIVLLAALPKGPAPPFITGDLAHDFGIVEIAPGHLESRTHQFALRNASGRMLMVDRITTTCGCAGATSTMTVIPDGESFEVDTTLVLDSTGTRWETVTIHFVAHEPFHLSIRGAGRMLQDLSCMPNVVNIAGEEGRTLNLFYADYISNELPSAPAFSAPSGIEVAFESWQQLLHLDKDEDQPARWHAQLMVSGPAPKVRGFSPLRITMPNGAETVV
jgi:hypothetical protein